MRPIKPFISKKDLLVVAAFWGALAGLGEGLFAFLQHSWIWPDLLRSAVIVEPLIFLAVPLLIRLVSPRFMPTPAVLTKATLIFSWLAFFAWARIFKSQWPVEETILAMVVLAAVVAFVFSLQMRTLLRLQRWSMPVLLLIILSGVFLVPIKQQRHEQRELARLPAARENSPNVLLIVVDTLRADHLSTYGYARPTSPQLTAIAKQGVLFENAIAPSSWTLPSHASILTGRYPHDHHIDQDYSYFGFDYPAIGDVLREQGYRTAAFSANGLLFSRERGFGHAFIHFEDDFQSPGSIFVHTYYGHKLDELIYHLGIYRDVMGRRRAKDINEHALRWMDHSKRPFFAVLNYFDTHDPYLPPEPYLHRYSEKKNPGRFSSRSWVAELTPEQVHDTIDAYDGAINYVDAQIGKLAQEMDRRGLTKNTLLIITSDHGEAFNEHGFMNHGNALYRGLIHVPLIFREPANIPAGMRISQPVSLTELAATVCDVAGQPKQKTFTDPSLAGFWTRPTQPPVVPAPLSELAQLGWNRKFPNYDGPMASVTTEQWHYIIGGRFYEELFAMADDPQERTNLAGSIAGLQAQEELNAKLTQAGEMYAWAGGVPPRSAASQDIAERQQTIALDDQPTMVAVADLNNDGDQDIVLASENARTLSVLLAGKKGKFKVAAGSPYRISVLPKHLAIRDVNGDGKSDVEFWDDDNGRRNALLGDGAGGFSLSLRSEPLHDSAQLLSASAKNASPPPVRQVITTRNSQAIFQRSKAQGDLNGDGIPDFAITNSQTNEVRLLLGTGTSSLIQTTIHMHEPPNRLALLDVNGDGKADLLVNNSQSKQLEIVLSK